MIPMIDVNATVGVLPDDPRDVSAAAYVAQMRRLGGGTAIVAHTAGRWNTPDAANRDARESALIPELTLCWSLSFAEHPAADAHAALAAGAVAARAYPAAHGYRLAGAQSRQALRVFADAGVPLLVDYEEVDQGDLATVLAAIPGLVVVLTQTGYRSFRTIVDLMLDHPGIVVDTSSLSTHEGLEVLQERGFIDRVVFGTGFPFRDPADAVARLLWSGLSDADAALVGSGNALRLFSRLASTAA
jgi:hypothetical protein